MFGVLKMKKVILVISSILLAITIASPVFADDTPNFDTVSNNLDGKIYNTQKRFVKLVINTEKSKSKTNLETLSNYIAEYNKDEYMYFVFKKVTYNKKSYLGFVATKHTDKGLELAQKIAIDQKAFTKSLDDMEDAVIDSGYLEYYKGKWINISRVGTGIKRKTMLKNATPVEFIKLDSNSPTFTFTTRNGDDKTGYNRFTYEYSNTTDLNYQYQKREYASDYIPVIQFGDNENTKANKEYLELRDILSNATPEEVNDNHLSEEKYEHVMELRDDYYKRISGRTIKKEANNLEVLKDYVFAPYPPDDWEG